LTGLLKKYWNAMIKFAEYQNKKIRYSDIGAGKVLVFLHGYLESLEVWTKLSEKLSTNFHVISIDLPGFGKSDCMDKIHTMELMAEAVNAVLNHAKVEKCNIFGHSLGGYVTLAFAEKFAEKTESFCLFHSHPFADVQATKEKRDKEIELVRAGKKKLFLSLNVGNTFANENINKLQDTVQQFNKIALETSDEGIIAALEGMKQRADRLHVIENTKLPFLYIIGLHDNFIPMQMLERIKFPASTRIEIFENSGHNGFVEEPEQAEAVIRDFVA
jgi:pimeloyl-ACP methyl ester carboxylesterase